MARAQFLEDTCKTALNRVPEESRVPFRWTINPYRGCTHSCHYCFARAFHTYLDLGIGDDFSSKIVVKTNLVEVLRRELASPRWGGEAVAVESVVEAMAEASDLPIESLRSSVTVHSGADAAAHLFAVTSGLESMVVGEDEISGQVRRALDAAREEGMTSGELERLFQKATHTSRGIRNNTGLRGTHRSLVRFALELAQAIADMPDIEATFCIFAAE